MAKKVAEVYIGLGSNMDDPRDQLHRALESLAAEPCIDLVTVSDFYQTPPIGPSQPDYTNAAAQLQTSLSPESLLDRLQFIEQQQDRVRTLRWGPRTLDLDILLFDDIIQDTERLTIPHPRMAERAFVLLPLAGINPNLSLPDGKTVSQLLANCSVQGIVKLSA
ncbi:MAG: 2-amino-4-hydroxy-6-hydroxymethyldihydropteridine diphosphokinase [Porticoccaceae bacterium]|nr:2-amino-4-hydroxy-6-hydroxymethyldihydropteridine diphosphokinase [Porticoccaceae bacterium]